MLKGTYRGGVVVKGVCAVKAGKAHVIGTLTVAKDAAHAAAFGAHHSSLTVTGNVVVDAGGFAILGCKANPDGTGIPCLDDPDAIEILASHIAKNLSCSGNSHPATSPPGAQPVWDSGETSMTPGVIFPRKAEPNTVGGSRSGQCMTATPTTLGGPSRPDTFYAPSRASGCRPPGRVTGGGSRSYYLADFNRYARANPSRSPSSTRAVSPIS